MTSTTDRHLQIAARAGADRPVPAQMQLALPVPTATAPAARDLPAQLRLDARTRQIGRAGIAELRRILSAAQVDQAEAA